MNFIPKVNGEILWLKEKCKVTLPLFYKGECRFEKQFEMKKKEDALCGPVLEFEQDEHLSEEGYVLEIQPEKISIKSKTEAGKYYGAQTLFALIEEQGSVLECVKISDEPKYGYRGFMIDVSRHFFPVEEIKKIVDQCAKYKLNKFHWHLSDDQGFRIESKKFPELNQTGAVRKEEDGTITKGFYTQEEIKEIVAYAADRQIEIIPEIDMPGHTTAIISAYPYLSCSGEDTEVKNKGGVYTQILCAGKEETMRFVYELLDEVVSLFPGRYFHIGGDEAPKEEWVKCEHCQKLIRSENLHDEEELQAHFTKKLSDYLALKGKTAIGWNEILASGKAEHMIAQYWMESGQGYSYDTLKKGQKFIFSNTNAFYMDYPYSMVTLKGTYMYEPNMQGKTDIPKEQILGLEAPVWTEYIATSEKLEKQIFPRIQALAENAWSCEKDYDDFLRRVKIQEKRLEDAGIVSTPVEEAALCGEEGICRILEWTENWIDLMIRGGVVVPKENIEGAAESGKQLILECMQYVYTKEEQEKAVRMFVRKAESQIKEL